MQGGRARIFRRFSVTRYAALFAALHVTLVAPTARADDADSHDPTSIATRAVYVHIDSPQQVDLQRETGQRYRPFETICTSPCDTLVPADGRYRVSSESVRASRPFAFPLEAQREDMRVRPGSRSGFTAGIILLSTGGAAFGLGVLWLFAQGSGDSPDPQDNVQAWHDVAIGLVLGGIAAITGGIVLTALNARTKVSSIETATPPPVKPDESHERTVMLPVRSATAMENTLPPATAIPVFAIRF
jgi:hypothetical protein